MAKKTKYVWVLIEHCNVCCNFIVVCEECHRHCPESSDTESDDPDDSNYEYECGICYKFIEVCRDCGHSKFVTNE